MRNEQAIILSYGHAQCFAGGLESSALVFMTPFDVVRVLRLLRYHCLVERSSRSLLRSGQYRLTGFDLGVQCFVRWLMTLDGIGYGFSPARVPTGDDETLPSETALRGVPLAPVQSGSPSNAGRGLRM